MKPATKDRRASQPDTELPIRFERDEDGKLHLYVDEDIQIHYNGNKSEVVNGSSVDFVHGDQFVITKGVHHTNPWGTELYDQLIQTIVDDPTLRSVMEAKLQLAKDQEKKINKHIQQQSLKDRLAKRNRNALKRKCKCDD